MYPADKQDIKNLIFIKAESAAVPGPAYYKIS